MADQDARDKELTDEELDRLVGGVRSQPVSQTPEETTFEGPDPATRRGSTKKGEAPDASPPKLTF